MPFTKFRRTHISANEPVISIYGNRFHYSAYFVKLAELKNYSYVNYLIDEEERKIGFEFSKTEKEGFSYMLENRGNKMWRSTANEIISKYSWIKKVALLKNRSVNKFSAKKRENIWVIQLCPTFEFRIPRDEVNKLGEVKGIYRYLLREEIVYIGKGNIKQRACDSERADWEFDTIEYSIIEDEEEQFSWEYYWLEIYKDQNHKLLPYYNKVSGQKP
ncbi:MAG: hypothetical protein KF816_02250 [Melioribacteraceae bacterium]|nr:hypothetical protein [Melioribacteraceae bacterium]